MMKYNPRAPSNRHFGWFVPLLIFCIAAVAQTRVVIFSAWSNGALRRDISVATTVTGSCWEHSLPSDRPDAWRCMSKNEIYDPCFAESPNGNKVACPEEPFSKSVILMRLTKALDPSGGRCPQDAPKAFPGDSNSSAAQPVSSRRALRE